MRHVAHRPLVEGTIQGRVYLSGTTESGAIDDGHGVIAPVVARSERIEVLEVMTGGRPGDRAEEVVSSLGLLMGYAAIAADHWTDGSTSPGDATVLILDVSRS